VSIVSADLGTPILANLEFLAENAGKAQVQLRWFCDPVGVERFEIWAAAESANDPMLTSIFIGPKLATTPGTEVADEVSSLVFSGYQTKTIASEQIGGGAEFSVVLNVPSSQTITYTIRAVGKGTEDGGTFTRPEGPYSNTVSGKWRTPPVGEQPIIPWPQLAPPQIRDSGAQINQYRAGEGPFYGIPLSAGDSHSAAILMGVFNSTPADKDNEVKIPFTKDPLDLFFTLKPQNESLSPDDETKSVIPFVVYRHQIPNATHPNAVPNLVQVSPLIDRITYGKRATSTITTKLLHDPFFRFIDFGRAHTNTIYDVPISGKFSKDTAKFNVGNAGDNAAALPYLNSGDTLLWWVDPMPVTKGARYQYLIVTFTKRGEINCVIPTNYVDQP